MDAHIKANGDEFLMNLGRKLVLMGTECLYRRSRHWHRALTLGRYPARFLPVTKTTVFDTHEAEACVIEEEELPVVDIVRSSREVILRSSHNRDSANFALTGFSEVRVSVQSPSICSSGFTPHCGGDGGGGGARC